MKPEVNGQLAKERLHELEALIKEKNYAFRKNTPRELEILVESFKDGFYHGFDQNFNKIAIQSAEDLLGNWVNIQKYEVQEEGNYAQP
jgi:tRNA A37 methylthiotransferase MiaB